MSELKTAADLESAIRDINREIRSFVEKANGEFAETGRVSTETKAALDKLAAKGEETFKRLDALEARLNTGVGLGQPAAQDTPGSRFVKSDAFAAFLAGRQSKASVEVKTAVVNGTPGTGQPLVQEMRVPGIIFPGQRRFTIRDLLPQGRTTETNAVSFTLETGFTNNAAPQYVSPARENVLKGESAFTYSLSSAPVVTVAHFLPVSKQVMADSPAFAAYIDGRLLYGLKLEEEDQLLNGLGTGGNINGLVTQAAAYNRAVTGDNDIDTLRRAITQVQLSEYSASAIVLNPEDWESIDLTKVGTSDDRYIVGNPNAGTQPTLWGRPVIATNSMAQGTFLVGAFDMGAFIWDRADATVQVYEQDSDNVRKNMLTVLAEERLALTVYRPTAFVKGDIGA